MICFVVIRLACLSLAATQLYIVQHAVALQRPTALAHGHGVPILRGENEEIMLRNHQTRILPRGFGKLQVDSMLLCQAQSIREGRETEMPTLSMFDGIKILMYYRDHHPPHFHVERADESAEVGIDPIVILGGELSRLTRA